MFIAHRNELTHARITAEVYNTYLLLTKYASLYKNLPKLSCH